MLAVVDGTWYSVARYSPMHPVMSPTSIEAQASIEEFAGDPAIILETRESLVLEVHGDERFAGRDVRLPDFLDDALRERERRILGFAYTE